ncbi:MAG: hypothetical protein LBU07_06325 [Coriobacteriales bacterium]|jgi:hypothetical protein|nr:hypothetical protein [Coriobacteriales bacterium]
MAETEKVQKAKALVEELKTLSAELSEDELAEVAGGIGALDGVFSFNPRIQALNASDKSIKALSETELASSADGTPHLTAL